jgi:hypothetical protein
VPSDATGAFLADATRVALWLSAVATAAGAAFTLTRGVRRTVRALVLWACEADVQARDTQHTAMTTQLAALDVAARAAEQRTAAALERVAEKLSQVVDEVRHITNALVEQALRRP